MKKITFIILLFSMTCLGQPSDSYVGRKKQTMQGIDKIKISVDYILPGTETLIPKATVLSLVEKKLKSAGMVILKEPYPPKSENIPTVHIIYSMHLEGEDDEYIKYSVSIQLSQNAMLIRDNEIISHVITWQQGFHGFGTAFNLNPINKQMLNYLDFFIEDWKSANIKKPIKRERLISKPSK